MPSWLLWLIHHYPIGVVVAFLTWVYAAYLGDAFLQWEVAEDLVRLIIVMGLCLVLALFWPLTLLPSLGTIAWLLLTMRQYAREDG